MLELPAIATASAKIQIGNRAFWNRARGELLHPERIDLDTLDGIRHELGNLVFEAQYQQRPAPPEGNLVRTEWFKTYEKLLPGSQSEAVLQSWDPAAVPGNSNDYSVCITLGLIGPHIDILHVYRQRHNFPDLQRAAVQLR